MAPRITRRTARAEPLKVVAKFVDNDDEVHVPTKRRVALPERMLAENLTVAEAKSLLDADADRLEPKTDGRKRKPVPGYGDEERAAAYRRVSKAARVAPEKLKDNRSTRADATKATKQYWNRIAKPVFEAGGNKKEAASFVVERTGGKANYNTVYRALNKPK